MLAPLQLGTAVFAITLGESFLVFAVLCILLGAGIGLFSREGSEVSSHPRGPGRGDAPGSASEAQDGEGELPGADGQRFPSTRGTR